MAHWTHEAELIKAAKCGPQQLTRLVRSGETVTLFNDPKVQEGELITFRVGHYTGVTRLSNLVNVRPS